MRDAVKEALTDSVRTRTKYAGKLQQSEIVEVFTDDGIAIQKEVTITISWATVEQMIGLIRSYIEEVEQENGKPSKKI